MGDDMNQIHEIQYKNMFRMVNDFLYQYRCQMEIRSFREKKEVYERDAINKRKRKQVSFSFEENSYLFVTGNGREDICSASESEDGKILVFLPPKLPYKKSKCEPDYIADDYNKAYETIEQICYKHYVQKYGETRAAYGLSFFQKRKTFKRLSVGEIFDWYEEFRKTDMTVDEIKEALLIKEEFKKQGLSVEQLKRALKAAKRIRKIAEEI